MNIINSILYIYNDMAVLFVDAIRLKYGYNLFPLFDPTIKISGIDFLNSVSLVVLFRVFDPVVGANILSIFYLSMLLFFSYKLFSYFDVNKLLVIVFSVTNTFSIYMLYRIISFTPNIYQVFFFPLVLLLLFKNKLSPLKLGLVVFLFFASSLYNGYYSFWLIIFWWLSELIYSLLLKKGECLPAVKSFIAKVLLFSFPLLLMGGIAFGSLAIKTLPFLAKFDKSPQNKVITNTPGAYRPIENFYNLTFRPWYFVIPPKNSLFFGDFSKNTYKAIEDTGYYLANDYTEEEAAGSFIGWHMLLGVFLAFGILLFGNKYSLFFPTLFNYKQVVFKALLSIFLIFLISGPPSFTVNGFTFYTPSYLLYFVLPIFRTLVRFSSIIFMLVLVINIFLYNDLLFHIRSKVLKFLVFFLLITMNFIFFAIKLPVIDINKPPKEFATIKLLPENSMVAVYPKADYKSMFWTSYTRVKLANPNGFINLNSGFSSDSFTKRLTTQGGIDEGKLLGITHILYYRDNGLPETEALFKKNASEIIDIDTSYVIYKLN